MFDVENELFRFALIMTNLMKLFLNVIIVEFEIESFQKRVIRFNDDFENFNEYCIVFENFEIRDNVFDVLSKFLFMCELDRVFKINNFEN